MAIAVESYHFKELVVKTPAYAIEDAIAAARARFTFIISNFLLLLQL